MSVIRSQKMGISDLKVSIVHRGMSACSLVLSSTDVANKKCLKDLDRLPRPVTSSKKETIFGLVKLSKVLTE